MKMNQGVGNGLPIFIPCATELRVFLVDGQGDVVKQLRNELSKVDPRDAAADNDHTHRS